MNDNFKLYDKEYHELNDAGQQIIRTTDGPRVLNPDVSVEPAFFGFKCPLRGTDCNYLRLRGGPADNQERPSWIWNRNVERPTIQPSINCQSHNPKDPSEKYAGCGWHGHITNGVIQ